MKNSLKSMFTSLSISYFKRILWYNEIEKNAAKMQHKLYISSSISLICLKLFFFQRLSKTSMIFSVSVKLQSHLQSFCHTKIHVIYDQFMLYFENVVHTHVRAVFCTQPRGVQKNNPFTQPLIYTKVCSKIYFLCEKQYRIRVK